MSLFEHLHVGHSPRGFTRRSFFQTVSAAAGVCGGLSFRDMMLLKADELRQQGRSLILLWMQGGPSQLETFDPKPGTDNGGPTEAIETAVPGIRIAKGWERTASVMKEFAVLRSVTNKEGQHQRATYQLHTGYLPAGSVRHPSLGCAIAKELAPADRELPAVVSVGGTEGAGFLGVDYEPFVVQDPNSMPRNVALTSDTPRYEKRLGLLDKLEGEFAGRGGETVVADHRKLYEKTAKMVLSPKVKAFDIGSESSDTRAKYGSSQFGRGCLLARRLVESGVTFVEVRSGNWDTHDDNFNRVSRLAGEVDPGMASLVSDLKERGLLDKTLVVWLGEFGRTPRINPRTGRDHYPRAFNALMAGGGIKGGQVYGETSSDGMSIKDKPVEVPDLFATICKSLNVNAKKENMSPQGRPLKIVDGGSPLNALFA